MLRQGKPNWVASLYAPNPKEVTYWIDLSSSSDGQIVRCYTNGKWAKLNEEQNNIGETDITALKNAVANLQTSKLDISEHDSFMSAVDSALSKKANTSNTYTKTGTDNAIATAIANKVTSTDINTIKVVSTLPTIQETGVLYIKIS